jgi:hypothetical protein
LLGLAKLGLSFQRSDVTGAVNYEGSVKVLTTGYEESWSNASGDWLGSGTSQTSTFKFGPYYYDFYGNKWTRRSPTLSKDLFGGKVGATLFGYKVSIDVDKLNKYFSDNKCDVIGW